MNDEGTNAALVRLVDILLAGTIDGKIKWRRPTGPHLGKTFVTSTPTATVILSEAPLIGLELRLADETGQVVETFNARASSHYDAASLSHMIDRLYKAVRDQALGVNKLIDRMIEDFGGSG